MLQQRYSLSASIDGLGEQLDGSLLLKTAESYQT